jgi:hypothetical protein
VLVECVVEWSKIQGNESLVLVIFLLVSELCVYSLGS